MFNFEMEMIKDICLYAAVASHTY